MVVGEVGNWAKEDMMLAPTNTFVTLKISWMLSWQHLGAEAVEEQQLCYNCVSYAWPCSVMLRAPESSVCLT